MNNLKPKVQVNTSTDLHYDLLADPTKIKLQTKNISLTHVSESEDAEDADDTKDTEDAKDAKDAKDAEDAAGLHIIQRIEQNNNMLSENSRKSSKLSSTCSSASTSSRRSHKKLVSTPPINVPLFAAVAATAAPIAVLPAAPKQTSLFSRFFGDGSMAKENPPTAAHVPETHPKPSNNYPMPSNPVKDNYDTLPSDQQRLRRLQKFAELKYIKDTYKIILTKEFSYNSDYHEMCAEIEFHRANISKKNSVEFIKSMVFGSVGMMDKMNKMFDPFGLKDSLDGFSEHLQVTTSDSEIYEELANKYKTRFKEYSVEMRFMLLLVGSAAGFVATKKAAENIPFFNNMDEKTKKDIMTNLTKNIQSTLIPPTASQKEKDEQNKILNFMMQQKKQEDDKNMRMANLLKQTEQQQQQQILQNLANSKKIDQSILITSSIDSEDSTLHSSA